MSEHVELIREAARQVRKRAEAAKRIAPATWRQILTDSESMTGIGICESHTGESFAACDNCWDIETYSEPVAEHIASWHPGVALLVADWLELEADMAEKRGNSPEGQTFHALALSRAIVGKGNENG